MLSLIHELILTNTQLRISNNIIVHVCISATLAIMIYNWWHFSALCTANVGIVLSSASGNATVHSTVLLVCVAGGNFTPEVTWHFSGSLIQSNVSTKVMS